jgi:hypothetical protein
LIGRLRAVDLNPGNQRHAGETEQIGVARGAFQGGT